MKDFNGFKSYAKEHNEEIHSSIHQRVLNAIDSQRFDDIEEKHEFYRSAWVELGIMEMLERYHNWLNS